MKIFMPAWSKKEAEECVAAGFGFKTLAEAKRAMSSPKIDPWYRQKYKFYKIDTDEIAKGEGER